MIHSFYTAATGTLELQKGMDVVANNISNSQTTGYKRDRSTFADLLYTNIRQPEGDSTLKEGHGTRLQKVDTIFTKGNIKMTDNNTDFAILDDNAYFAVQTSDGIKYTRSGAFHLSDENGKSYLVSSSGNGYALDTKGYALDSNGQKIEITEDMLDTGKVNLGLYSFRNEGGLQKEAGTFFVPTENSGEATPIENPSTLLKQNALETSTVDLAQEMSDLIMTQRAFQFNTKMVQTADEVMQTVNSLR